MSFIASYLGLFNSYNIHLYVNSRVMYAANQQTIIWCLFCVELFVMILTMLWIPCSLYICFKTQAQNKFSSIQKISVCIGSLMAERYFAVVHAETYSTKPYRKVSVTIMTVTITTAAWEAVIFTFGGLSQLMSTIWAVGHALPFSLMALWILRKNDLKRKQLLLHWRKSGYSLAKRYQITENVKAFRVLTVLIIYTVISHSFLGATFIFYLTANISWETKNYIGAILDLKFAIYVFLMSFLGYLTNREWYNLSKHTLTQLFRKLNLARRCYRRPLITPDARKESEMEISEAKIVLDPMGKNSQANDTQNTIKQEENEKENKVETKDFFIDRCFERLRANPDAQDSRSPRRTIRAEETMCNCPKMLELSTMTLSHMLAARDV
ncbi:unnamed protein product, partial [Mesorhabditis belari]|uniref:Uncharacterized protein n=1 Tax=Mesorhabditis belari TaxID=2138241 RepID=A0AAF3FNC9_9BILA